MFMAIGLGLGKQSFSPSIFICVFRLFSSGFSFYVHLSRTLSCYFHVCVCFILFWCCWFSSMFGPLESKNGGEKKNKNKAFQSPKMEETSKMKIQGKHK